jgi:hypothetical protein
MGNKRSSYVGPLGIRVFTLHEGFKGKCGCKLMLMFNKFPSQICLSGKGGK